MTDYIISDLHISHRNILNYQPNRKFENAQEINAAIISNWNSIVKETDLTYILGDVGFGDIKDLCGLINQLNGDKILVIGNHDKRYINKPLFRECFREIHKTITKVINGKKIYFVHEPYYKETDGLVGTIDIFLSGHLHNSPLDGGRYQYPETIELVKQGELIVKDVGLDTTPDLKPYNLDGLLAELLK